MARRAYVGQSKRILSQNSLDNYDRGSVWGWVGGGGMGFQRYFFELDRFAARERNERMNDPMRGDTSKWGKERREGEGPQRRRAQKLVPVRSRPIPVNRIVIFKRQTQKKFKISTCLGTAGQFGLSVLSQTASRAYPHFLLPLGHCEFRIQRRPDMIVKVNV